MGSANNNGTRGLFFWISFLLETAFRRPKTPFHSLISSHPLSQTYFLPPPIEIPSHIGGIRLAGCQTRRRPRDTARPDPGDRAGRLIDVDGGTQGNVHEVEGQAEETVCDVVRSLVFAGESGDQLGVLAACEWWRESELQSNVAKGFVKGVGPHRC